MNLKEIESKAWTSTFEDGVFEIVVGLAFVASGVGRFLSGYYKLFYIKEKLLNKESPLQIAS